MKFKAGDFVKFKNFEDMPDEITYNMESDANNFHKNHMGQKFKVREVERPDVDPRIILAKNKRFRFKIERFRKYVMDFELDDNLFQL